jgi:hypothetical protein
MKRRREMEMKRNGEEKRNGDEEKRKNEQNEGRRGLYSNISIGITDGTLIVVGGIQFCR